jgi:hypothetical protein
MAWCVVAVLKMAVLRVVMGECIERGGKNWVLIFTSPGAFSVHCYSVISFMRIMG